MPTHSKHDLSIDLFNLPPLPDERNAMDSYLNVPMNFYIPDGKNSRLLQRTDRIEFNRETLDGNQGFLVEIPYLEHACDTKYFFIDKVNGKMMAILDDQVQSIEAKASNDPFDLAELEWAVCVMEQKWQGFDQSSIIKPQQWPQQQPQSQQAQVDHSRMQDPSTPKSFNTFDHLRNLGYDGQLLTVEMGSQMYCDWVRVIAEMADAYQVFSRSLFFNPEMIEQYKACRAKYIMYFAGIVCNIDIYLQEDQLTWTRSCLPLVPVPTYMPNSYELEQIDAKQIESAVHADMQTADDEMYIIISKSAHNRTNSTTGSSCSSLRSFELNDMGFGLNRISPITLEVENSWTPENQGMQETLTPREWGGRSVPPPPTPMNRTYPLPQAPHVNFGNSYQSYDADTSARESHRLLYGSA